MSVRSTLKHLAVLLVFGFSIAHATEYKGGIVLMGTRIIMSESTKQATVSIMNTSKEDSYLIQSWGEDINGNKTKDIIITPPLYVSSPGGENKLRVLYAGKELPKDRETLYYFVEKAIPSVEKTDVDGKNIVLLATANKIKLFIRPTGLTPTPDKAPEKLTFKRKGKKLEIKNNSPYYLTLVDMLVSGKKMESIMIPPMKHVLANDLPAGASSVSFSVIDDYGATTPQIKKTIE